MQSTRDYQNDVRRALWVGVAITVLLAALRFAWRMATATQISASIPMLRELCVHSFWILAAPLLIGWTAHPSWRRSISFVAFFLLVGEPVWTLGVLRFTQFADVPLVTLYLARTDLNAVIVGLLVGIGFAWQRQRTVEQGIIAAARLQQRLAEAQLSTLTLQLQPHFIFNTLQLVMETVRSRAKAAATIVRDLRQLVLEATNEHARRVISMREELAILEAYASIQRTRFEGRIQIEIHLDGRVADALIPRMLLQPLVENAIHHGVGGRSAGGRVTIRALPCGRRSDRVEIVVEDDGDGLGAVRSGRGMGLSNTRARLTAMFGNNWSLALRKRPHGGVESRIEMPVRIESPPTFEGSKAAAWSTEQPMSHTKWLIALAAVWMAAALSPVVLRVAFALAGWTAADPMLALRVATRDAPLWLLALLSAHLVESTWSFSRGLRGSVLGHGAGLCFIGALTMAVVTWFPAADDPVAPTITVLRVLTTYCASAFLAHAHALGWRNATASRRIAELAGALRQTEEVLSRAQAHSNLLVQSLDRIERSCTASTEACHREVLKFANLLRTLLDELGKPPTSTPRVESLHGSDFRTLAEKIG